MRVVVIGTSGAGKSTFAKALAEAESLPYIELDGLWWAPNWTTRDPEAFRESVAVAISGTAWVVDGNYSVVRSVLWPKATHVIWLNFGRVTVFSRVLVRTIRRVASRQVLWAGNTESFRKAFLSQESILLWSLSTFTKNRIKFAALRADPKFAHLSWREFKSARRASEYLRSRRGADNAKPT